MIHSCVRPNRVVWFFGLTGSLALLSSALAQPTIVSTVPANFATGVSPTAPVIFTFSTAMDTSATYAVFFDTLGNSLLVTPSWSADMKVLTNTPNPPFPSPNKMIAWSVNGFDQAFNPLGGDTSGFFTTGSGGGGTGSGTNSITTFSVGKTWNYLQTSSAAPFLSHDNTYQFIGTTALKSNRTATSVGLTLPTSVMTSLTQNALRPELFLLVDSSTNLSSFDTNYPNGDYVFDVQAATSNQQVTVNLPSNLAQPGAPQVSNFTAAQSIDPAQPFTLTWDAFPGGTAADYINLEIEGSFRTPDIFTPGALNGTATSVLIPATTLPPNRFLQGHLAFFHYIAVSNSSDLKFASRATVTQFFVTTTSGSAGGPLVLTNASWSGGTFSFAVTSAAGQTLTVEYSTNMQAGSWNKLVTTNSPAGRVWITDPQAILDKYRLYRARTGS
jgi:hypothetical protein